MLLHISLRRARMLREDEICLLNSFRVIHFLLHSFGGAGLWFKI